MEGPLLGPCLLEIYAATVGQSPNMVPTDRFQERAVHTLK